MSEKAKRHLRFTFYDETIGPAPQITLNYTAAARAPGQQRVTLMAGKSKTGAAGPSKKPPPTGLARILNDIVRKVAQKDTERIFAAPVTEDIAPDYYLVIKDPIDLSVIKTKVHNNEYENLSEFRADMKLMFRNCLTYNQQGTFFYKEGEKLLNFFRREVKLAKDQLGGRPSQPEVSSSARAASGREISIERDITGVDIPVEIERKPRKPDSAAMIQSLPQPAKTACEFYYVANPPGECVGDKERFEVAREVIASNEKIRGNLKLLRDRFPQFIVDDAVRRLSGVDDSFVVDASAVAEALESQVDIPGIVGVGRAPIEISALNELAAACPDLPLALAKGVNDAKSDIRQQNLRLLLFYNNCMKFWKKSELNPAKKKVMEAIRRNIAQMAREMTPATLVKASETYSRHVISHIITSLRK